MRNFIFSGIIILLFAGCSSHKKLQTETPFVLGNVTAQKWVGGMEQTGTGYELTIPIINLPVVGVDLQEVYFRDKVAEVSIEKENDIMVGIAKYASSKPDSAMQTNPIDEVGNRPPSSKIKSKKKFPFKIDSNEAILSYNEDGKDKFYKITNIKEMPVKTYRAAKPQN